MTTNTTTTTNSPDRYDALIKRILANEGEFRHHAYPNGDDHHDVMTCPIDGRRYLILGQADMADTPVDDDEPPYYIGRAVCLDDKVERVNDEYAALPLYDIEWELRPDALEAWKQDELGDVDGGDMCDWTEFAAYRVSPIAIDDYYLLDDCLY